MRPERIADAVAARIERGPRASTARTPGSSSPTPTAARAARWTRSSSRHGVERIGGAHCFEFYAGAATYAELQDAEPGTFYLTDFLARQFESLIIAGLGLDRHPELRDAYFGNYTAPHLPRPDRTTRT